MLRCMACLAGKTKFRFSQIKLKMVILHPCGYIRETIRDPRRDSGVVETESKEGETDTVGYHLLSSDMKKHASGS